MSSDMQKFPLRMKDNDLLVTELYRDPAGDKVTALSVYLTPKTSKYRRVFIPPAKRSFREVYCFQPVRDSVIPSSFFEGFAL